MKIIERRKIYYIISLILIIPSIISLMFQGLNLGIDFRGGSLIHVQVANETTSAEVRTVLNDLGLGYEFNVQQTDNQFYIRTAELNQEETQTLLEGLRKSFGEVELLSSESVGAVIGSELTRNAILSLLIASVLMLIYITFRFELSFGIAAIIGILHNVIIVLGMFSIFQWDISGAFIAAMLTVIGYSINDTIVVFDRVRENIKMQRKEDRMTMLNRSIMQTLTRSINTVLTTSLALAALLLFGGVTLKVFILAMLIGFIAGAYSSIFIASPIWYEIKSRA